MSRYIDAHRAVLAVLGAWLALLSVGRASAAEYLFGFSLYDGNETLTLDLASGGSVVLSTDGQQGWWSATDPNSAGNTNYFVGSTTNGDTTANLRDFFTFDISGLAGDTVSAATLSLTAFDSTSDSGRSQQQFTLSSVSVPAAILDDTEGTSATIFDALAGGTVYGSFSVPVTGFGFGTDTFTLDAAGVAALNAAISAGADSFSIGGSLSSANAVPEPRSLLPSLAGLLGLGVVRRRRMAARSAGRRYPLTIA